MSNKPIIPIFFSTDDNYLPFLAVSITSMLENASPDYHYTIYILNNGLTPKRVAPILAMKRENADIRLVDVSLQLAPIAERLNLRDYYTVSIYFRLFIASMFPQYHKAIYLDADITVNGDISKLYATSLGSNLVGAVSDDIIASCRDFRLYAEEGVGVAYDRYFNSGVMLMNLDAFRMEHIEEKFVYLLETYHFETVCPDQDYLNLLCRGRVMYLDKGWNKMSIDTKYDGIPNLIHYNMFYKPWLYKRVAYARYFWKYAAMTSFEDELKKIQKGFGIKGKLAHKKAHLMLHKNTKRIRRMENNFCRVSEKCPIEKMPWKREDGYHA